MTASFTQANARILLAEDNPADVYLIRRALKEHGVDLELEVAENGKQALLLLQRSEQIREGSPIGLIVLDLNLPLHDGTEILQCIRRTKALATVPVVVLTSSDSTRDQLTAMGSGASHYMRKPSNLEDYMAIGAALKDIVAASAGLPAPPELPHV